MRQNEILLKIPEEYGHSLEITPDSKAFVQKTPVCKLFDSL